MPLFSRELGIDLGTLNIVVTEGNQILLQEPTVVAIVVDELKMVEWGQAAKNMYGRVPESIEVIWPLRHGVIAEYEITEKLLAFIIKKMVGPMLIFRPRAMITVPYGITSVETRAVHEAGLGAGCREIFLIQQPLAAALGVDLPISTPSGNMMILMGGGMNQAGVLAMNSIISAGSSRTGGLAMDEAIISYVRKKYGVIIAQPTAEQLKIRIGAAIPQSKSEVMEIQGQNQVSGLPQSLELTTDDIVDALQEPLDQLVVTVKKVLEKTPPELAADIVDRGIVLTGGGALLKNLDKLLREETSLPITITENPLLTVALGSGQALDSLEILKQVVIS